MSTRTMFKSASPRGEQSGQPDYPRRDALRARAGRSFARSGPRKLIAQLTGKSTKSVHLRIHGERAVRLEELEALARSDNPKLNPMHLIVEALSVIEGARRSLDVSTLLVSALARSSEEQRSDGAEDVTQLALHGSLELMKARGADRLSPRERDAARAVIAKHRDTLNRHAANALALAADLDALEHRLEMVH